ncbi:MAG: hypothetical protein NT040_16095 [Bacteroidetes bacterium]|nr:hypothetical protein [Bacteroidota bacterium]
MKSRIFVACIAVFLVISQGCKKEAQNSVPQVPGYSIIGLWESAYQIRICHAGTLHHDRRTAATAKTDAAICPQINISGNCNQYISPSNFPDLPLTFL